MSDTTSSEQQGGVPNGSTPPTPPPPPATPDAEPERGFEPVEERFPPPPPLPPPPSAELPLPLPMRLVFGDMAGAFFLCWIPAMLAFFLPWSQWFAGTALLGGLTCTHLAVAIVIALPAWIVLILHLVRGRLWDGILDMLLWALWECMVMITLCYLYPGRAEDVIWRASIYWDDMRAWLTTGVGIEGNPLEWMPIHLRNLIILVVGAFIFGLPALVMGVLQLNFMNFYVAQCLLASDNALLTLPIAWHFWSIIRVVGYIVLAASMFQACLKLVFRAPARWSGFWWGVVLGLVLVIVDALLKWQYAETVRLALVWLTKL